MKIAPITAIAVAAALIGIFAVAQKPKPKQKPEAAMDTSAKPLPKTDAEWKKLLTPEQFRVTRQKGTEAPFTGQYVNTTTPGTYCCVCCGEPLFSSDAKFPTECGWPGFSKPIDAKGIAELQDLSHNMRRTEVQCKKCGAHLGHVFNDGPKPTGLRYCINSVAVKLEPKKAADEKPASDKARSANLEKATFAGGCFWGVEEVFRQIRGVKKTTVGYEGGTVANPTYQQVCGHRTGHAESLELEFDPAEVTYDQLLEVFFSIHNPTTKDRQGPDIGPQYRSEIFYHSSEQKAAAEAMKKKLGASGKFKAPIVTLIEPAVKFWPAEDYHQRYFEKKGGVSCHALPENVKKLMKGE